MRRSGKSRVQEGGVIEVGTLKITPRLTPGHAADGVTYVVEGWANAAPAVTVVGDAVFAGLGKDFETPAWLRKRCGRKFWLCRKTR